MNNNNNEIGNEFVSDIDHENEINNYDLNSLNNIKDNEYIS